MNYTVNSFGFLPTNPDIYFDSNPIGGGTERPVGFSFDQICKLYWTVKSFKVNASIEIPVDILTAFLAAGGSSGTILGSIVGLDTAGTLLSKGKASSNGSTKIKTSFIQKNRTARITNKGLPTLDDKNVFLWRGIQQNEFIYNTRRKTASETNLLKQQSLPFQLNVINSSPTELSLLSAGPIHAGAGVTIDMSSIIYKNNLYWPKVIISFDSVSSLASSGGVECLGGISFLGKLIPVYVENITFAIVAFASGSIQIGNTKYDRFYFDGKDEIRKKDNSIK